jgi:hypothetical protein
MEEIMDWTDCYTENCSEDPNGSESAKVLNAILELWIGYADFESSYKQFKNAVEVYEKAINDPYVGKKARVYQSFADYHMNRNKPGNAQKAIIRGLCAGLDETENHNLWNYLLQLTNKIANNTQATMQQLYNAVVSQVPDASKPKLAPIPLTSAVPLQNPPKKEFVQDFPESKEELKRHEPSVSSQKSSMPSTVPPIAAVQPKPAPIIQQLQQPAPSQQQQTPQADDFDNLSGMTPEQVVHLFRFRPIMLFAAPNKEPMASGILKLTPQEIQLLEAFLGVPLASLSQSGDDPSSFTPERKKAEYLLDILEQLWNVQALKERHFDAWTAELHRVHMNEEKLLLNRLKSSTGIMPPPAIIAQTPEMKKFRKHCEVQIELLNAVINKIMFSVLMEQVKLLSDLNFPLLHSDFYMSLMSSFSLKKSNLLTRGKESLLANAFFDEKINTTLLSQQKLLCAVFSIRLNTIQEIRFKTLAMQRNPQGTPSHAVVAQQQQQQQVQQGISHVNIHPNNSQQTVPMDANQPVPHDQVPKNVPIAVKQEPQDEEEQQQYADGGMELSRLPSEDFDDAPGSERKKRKKRRRSNNMLGSHEEDFPPTPESGNFQYGDNDHHHHHHEDPSVGHLTRQYSNTYSEASIDDYSQNAHHQDTMMQDILESKNIHDELEQPQPQQWVEDNTNRYIEAMEIGTQQEGFDDDAASLFQELKSIIQK